MTTTPPVKTSRPTTDIAEKHDSSVHVPGVGRVHTHNAIHSLELALAALALVALAVALLTSVTRADLPWDSWAYHLPFSAYLWDIGGGEQSFLLDIMSRRLD